VAPRAWLFFVDSAPFDLVAIPEERSISFQQASFFSAIRQVINDNITIKIQRITTFFQ
jgi:hypothetical protein